MATRINPELVPSNETNAPPPASPTNLTPAPQDSTKIKGTDGNDVFTLTDVGRDSDHVITTGLGNDVFRFNGSEGARNVGDQNGIIKFGGAANGAVDNDQVVIGYQITDYAFTLRSGDEASGGGIKIQYVGSDPDVNLNGAAVTFYGAETFTFRGVSDEGGPNISPQTYTYAELVALINASAPMMG